MAPNPSGKPIPDRPNLTLIALALGSPVAALPSAARFLALAAGRNGEVPMPLPLPASAFVAFSVPVVTFVLGLLLLHLRVAADEPPPPVSAAAAERLAAAAMAAATATLLLGAALFYLGF